MSHVVASRKTYDKASVVVGFFASTILWVTLWVVCTDGSNPFSKITNPSVSQTKLASLPPIVSHPASLPIPAAPPAPTPDSPEEVVNKYFSAVRQGDTATASTLLTPGLASITFLNRSVVQCEIDCQWTNVQLLRAEPRGSTFKVVVRLENEYHKGKDAIVEQVDLWQMDGGWRINRLGEFCG